LCFYNKKYSNKAVTKQVRITALSGVLCLEADAGFMHTCFDVRSEKASAHNRSTTILKTGARDKAELGAVRLDFIVPVLFVHVFCFSCVFNTFVFSIVTKQ